MLSGAQQLDLYPGATVDGVFGMWYGKGPGVDRSADAFRCRQRVRHAPQWRRAGRRRGRPRRALLHLPAPDRPDLRGGDDAGAAAGGCGGDRRLRPGRHRDVALLRPVGRHEDHRRDGGAGGDRDRPVRAQFVTPDIAVPPHGFNIDTTLHWPAERVVLERRMLDERLPAALAWCAGQRLDRVTQGRRTRRSASSPSARRITTCCTRWPHGPGRHPGLAIYKVGMTWPLETEGLRAFARGKPRAAGGGGEALLRRGADPRRALQPAADSARPCWARRTCDGAPLLPAAMELSPELVAGAGRVLPRSASTAACPTSGRRRAAGRVARPRADVLRRLPAQHLHPAAGRQLRHGRHRLPRDGDAEHAAAPGRSASDGRRGRAWVGLAPFTDLPHMFANMGDGTYQHSGLLAIRQAVAAKSRITYKLLFNDAVAMTGGQPAEGGPTVIDMARQVCGRGRRPIAVVADDPARLPAAAALPPGTCRHGRDELDAVQAGCAAFEGASAIIYDQVCATEKRRRRKRGTMAAAEREGQHQRPRVRELRRLHRAVALHRHRADRHRVRPQAPHQPDQLQHRPVLPERVLPLLRHRRHGRAGGRPRRRLAGAGGRAGRRPAEPALPDLARPGAGCSPASAAAASSPRAPWWRWRRTWRAGRSARWTSPGWRRRTAPWSPTCRSADEPGWTWCASRAARRT